MLAILLTSCAVLPRRDLVGQAGAAYSLTLLPKSVRAASSDGIHTAVPPAISGKPLPLTIGLGTCLVRLDDAARTVAIGLDAGYRVFDTAQRYGNEGGVGKALRRGIEDGLVGREEVFVSTKVWVDNMGTGKTASSVEASARAMGLDYLDQVLIHWPGPFVGRGKGFDESSRLLRQETWAELEALQRSGLARTIGVSNFSERHLKELLGYAKQRPAANQFEVHPYNQRTALVELCREEGIVVNSYCPLGGRGNKGQVTDSLLKDPTLKSIASAHGRTIPQVILRWHLQRGLTPIPKASSKAHIVENFAALEFALSDAQMADIGRLNRDQFALFDADAIA